ncbi:metalloregulator ArsR/SmtB family transcription factor [Bifidobacterium pullorum]|uniref:Metalloregulator ArsR/SmtB family transcription factor n=1 Tax=Bifidobacterium pullorum subsp. gallinarum TaxID=78344 RepID=A0A921IYT2_9BIFI|nr:metalloregulator ArsR/SmtB family transcription factor [Bifidobacterium pullorum]HJG41146.1 metalloregulator ArsR/SmtB family transcription factor [Bifidobacterium pullorum subsp. gallinarum]
MNAGKVRVAFICTHNACRSQIAEAVARMRASDVIEPYSAGTDPLAAPNPDALRLLAKGGIDVSMLRSKALDEIPRPDIVVTMGCGVSCPALPCQHREDWGLDDPTGKEDAAYDACIDAIARNVDDLADRIRAADGWDHDRPDVSALRALADETRLTVVRALAHEEELCACKLLDRLHVSQSTLSHHMKVLVDAGLVHQRRDGRWMHYRIDADRLVALGESVTALGRGGHASNGDNI